MNELGSKNSDSVSNIHQTLFQTAMKVTKHSNELPSSGADWDYYQSFSAYAGAMKHYSGRITNLMTKIYNHYGLTGKLGKLDFEEQMEFVSDNNDVLMERIGMSLDEAAGLKKQAETVVVEMVAKTSQINGSWNRHSVGTSGTTSYKLLSAKNISRPQMKFKEKIRNKPGPFVPKIKDKPHSLKPLAILLELDDNGDEEYSHPYEFELERFAPDPKLFTTQNVVPPFKKVEETPLVMVETVQGLTNLIEDLSKQPVVAVDLEAHSYRTFQGITCLMQISTATTDYIVDTLELWDNLQPLNEVFCNPKIVKIFHGADLDVQWLQRDFGIYIVNMFDTYHAAKLLGFPQLNLAFLLRHYCQVVVDKQYQLADWRIRPLPEEMVKYAREDTHYLGYVYERMKQDLKTKGTGDNLLAAVWQNSRLVCLKRYKIPPMTEESHLEMYRNSKKIFNERQLYALKQLYAWRDHVAREEDESIGYVLPKHMMLQIADVLPREMQGILACCSPIPPLVRQHLLRLHDIILKAREMPLSKLQHHGQPLAIPKLVAAPLEQDTEDPLHCVHDLTHSQDIRDDLPTLLSDKTKIESMATISIDELDRVQVAVKDLPQSTVFAQSTKVHNVKGVSTAFVSPYTRYMRARAQMSADEATEAERVEKLRKHFIDEVIGTKTNDDNTEQTKSEENQALEEAKAQKKKEKKERKKELTLAVQGLNKKKKNAKAKANKRKAAAERKATEAASSSSQPIEATGETTPKATKNKRKREEEEERKAQNVDNSKRNRQQEENRTAFEPFDYTKVDYQAFRSSAPDRGEGGRGRGRKGGRGRGGNIQNNRIHKKSGERSLTYGYK